MWRSSQPISSDQAWGNTSIPYLAVLIPGAPLPLLKLYCRFCSVCVFQCSFRLAEFGCRLQSVACWRFGCSPGLVARKNSTLSLQPYVFSSSPSLPLSAPILPSLHPPPPSSPSPFHSRSRSRSRSTSSQRTDTEYCFSVLIEMELSLRLWDAS